MGLAITVLRVVYVICVTTLALYTWGQIYLLYVYIRHAYFNTDRRPTPEHMADDELPRVTIQLPLYNERYVGKRIIDAVAEMDYPQNKLHIQVLDDSTDDSLELLQTRVSQLQAEGLRIDLIHRTDRTGYKAGALANGLMHTDGEFIAIFDADFIPKPDFLRQTIPYFKTDPNIGVVQTRWGHLNDDENLLTRSQALAIDGHFAVEQFARSAGKLIFSFNGTGGVWRRSCIVDAGGWQCDTLTEDFDLSYRAQIKGWRFLFVRDIMVPGEVPPQLGAYKQQQARWSKGSTQVLMKMAVPLIFSKLGIRQRLMGLVQLFQYTIQLVIFLTLLLSPLVVITHTFENSTIAPLGILGLCAPLLSILGQQSLYRDWAKRCIYFPVMVLFSSGMLVNNSRAAISALLQRPGEFQRTPKFHVEAKPKRRRWMQRTPQSTQSLAGEFFFGLYAFLAMIFTYKAAPSFMPYFLLYTASFWSLVAWGLKDRWNMQRRPVRSTTAAEAEPIGQPGR